MVEDLIEKVKNFLSPHDTVIVGLSGGADSMALMSLLSQVGHIKIVAAHCNFHLRGQEADRDQAFVEEMISKLWSSHTLEIGSFDTVSYAQKKGVSIEMAARELRYKWFEELRQRHQASLIVVGHHLNDQVETIFLNLLRGTGGAGLIGMSTLSGNIYRPLLTITREQILTYLQTAGIGFVTDSTNDDNVYRRNLIRSKVLPLLTQINPNLYQTISRSIDIFREEQTLISEQVYALERKVYDFDTDTLDLRKAEQSPHTRLLLFRILQKRGMSPTVIDDILLNTERENAIFFSSDKSLKAELFRGKLFFSHTNTIYTEALSSSVLYNTYTRTPIGEFYFGAAPTNRDFTLRFSLPADTDSLYLRYATPEDSFRPYGMKKGKKKVFTYLKEQGLPPMYRSDIPVLICGNDILAVVPFQIDDRFSVRDDQCCSYTLTFTPTLASPLSYLIASLMNKN